MTLRMFLRLSLPGMFARARLSVDAIAQIQIDQAARWVAAEHGFPAVAVQAVRLERVTKHGALYAIEVFTPEGR